MQMYFSQSLFMQYTVHFNYKYTAMIAVHGRQNYTLYYNLCSTDAVELHSKL